MLDESSQKLYALLALIAVSAVGFVVTGEQIVVFETKRVFSFANPIYLINVGASFCCLAVSSLSFFELLKFLNFVGC